MKTAVVNRSDKMSPQHGLGTFLVVPVQGGGCCGSSKDKDSSTYEAGPGTDQVLVTVASSSDVLEKALQKEWLAQGEAHQT